MSSAGAPASTIHETKDTDLADTLGEPFETDKPRFSRVAPQRERQLVG